MHERLRKMFEEQMRRARDNGEQVSFLLKNLDLCIKLYFK